eukprot:Nitzschia sp. Nitz4//scaffold138_size62050//52546//54577//NITZ4_006398-RA/size62050-augustus-gene-0.25-mRNA-1//1//CDS//3329535797//9123//frame0
MKRAAEEPAARTTQSETNNDNRDSPTEALPASKVAPDTPQHQSLNKDAQPSSGSTEKGLTFRKRRLSMTNLRLLDNEFQAEQELDHVEPLAKEGNHTEQQPLSSIEGEDTSPYLPPPLASSFRKRRLSLTNKQQETAGDPATPGSTTEPAFQRRRRNSDASTSSLDPTPRLRSRVVHASELLAHPPSSPSVHQLYNQKNAPPNILRSASFHLSGQDDAAIERLDLTLTMDSINQEVVADVAGTVIPRRPPNERPKWVQRHIRDIHDDEESLPFPRDIVGTFSCHGIEPLEDGTEDEAVEGSSMGLDLGSQDPDQPTTAAKINQDRGGVAFPYGNSARTALFAVYDGHGQGGELVSQFALHEVQRRLEKHRDFTKNIEKAFKETFLSVDKSLKKEELIEPLFAGTTACVALLRNNQLVLANAGDSRAVLARWQEHKVGEETKRTLVAMDLTKDQNPDLPEEQARIERMGGFISPPLEPGLSARVWLDVDCTQIGLAMARSLGDHAVKEVGVIAEPVVSFHDVGKEDEFVLFATDGVWEFVSSQEAVQVVAENLDRGATKACQALIETAAARWHEEEGDYRDDITALVVRLPQLWESAQFNPNDIKAPSSSSSRKDKSRRKKSKSSKSATSSSS